MSVHWIYKRKAVALLGAALERAGWRLLGWKPDCSDASTDCYDPEAWDGVAVRALPDGRRAVACVAVSAYVVRRLSGKGPARSAPPSLGPCSCCDGTGKALRDAPELVTRDVVTWRAVSVSAAKTAGVTPCSACGGTGSRLESRGVVYPEAADWPAFQENPKNAAWHVEIDGRIVATGSGVYSALGSSNDPDSVRDERFDAVASRITAAATLRERPAPAPGAALAADVLGEAPDGGSFRVRPSTVRADYVEVLFAAKPEAVTRDTLKRCGFRWSGRSACWYGPAARLPAAFAGEPAAQEA